MIPTPDGWTKRYHAGGALLVPPDGTDRGAIYYVESLVPLAPISTLVDHYLRERPFVVEHVGAIERFTTVESEHAALVTIRGTFEGIAVQRDLGFVLFDRHYARVGGFAFHREDFAAYSPLVRELTRGEVQFLGERARRFEYDPMPGWQARARGLHADWYPDDFPRTRAVLHVFPAIPAARVGNAEGLAALLATDEARSGWADDDRSEPFQVQSSHGLTGRQQTYSGQFGNRPRCSRELVILEDERYVYPIQLEAERSASDASTTLQALVRSVRPIPRLATVAVTAFPQWSEV